METQRHKYQHVHDQLLDVIELLTVGEALPPERSLCAIFGVSRVTLRRAIDELAREGYLVRRQGSGTFVARPKITQPLTLTSFSEDMRSRGFSPSNRTLAITTVNAGARLGRKLKVSPETKLLEVSRLRLADKEAMAIETLCTPWELLPGLEEHELTEFSFYELLRERYGVVIDSGVQTIEPTVTNEEESAVLGVPLHSPAFLFERTTHSEEGRVVEFVHSIYRGDRYKITTELPSPEPRPSKRSAGWEVKSA